MSYAQSLESIGRQWLIANGADASRLNIKSKLALREFAIFEDDKNGAFVIVVTDKYAQYVDNRLHIPLTTYSPTLNPTGVHVFFKPTNFNLTHSRNMTFIPRQTKASHSATNKRAVPSHPFWTK